MRITLKYGKLRVHSTVFESDAILRLPEKNFSQKYGWWNVPLSAANLSFLSALDAVWTNEAWDAYQMRLKEVAEANAKLPLPDLFTFLTLPRPFQMKAVDQCFGKTSFGLFMDIGTGKSKVALDIAGALYAGSRIDKLFICGLNSLKENWLAEIKTHMPVYNDVFIWSPASKKKFNKWVETPFDGVKVLIAGVESLSAGAAIEYFKKFVDDSTFMVLDESTSIKNYTSIRTRRAIELGEMSAYKCIMSGTPITQGIKDLYAQFAFLNRDIIGLNTFTGFRNRYCVMGGYEDKQIIMYKNVQELLDKVSPHIYQVRKRDVLPDLPKITRQVRMVDMSREQKEVYQSLKKKLVTGLGDHPPITNVLTMYLRLQEVCGGRAITDDGHLEFTNNPKLKALVECAESLPNDEPVIIFANYVEEVRMIETELKKLGRCGLMLGEIPQKERDETIKEFQDGAFRFLICTTGTAGIGLNLQISSTIIYYGRSFSLEKNLQSEGRVDRIGQMNPVTYIDLCMRNSVDEEVLEALDKKLDLAEFVRSKW